MSNNDSLFSEVISDKQIRVTVLGDANVGKTALIQLFARGCFPAHLLPSYGIDFERRVLKVLNQYYRLAIWDTAGTTRYQSISLTYAFQSQGIILVYDVTDRKSFVSISGWLKSVRQISKESKVLLLGNKCDLRSSSSLNHSIVSTEEGKRFADENDLLFAEISVVNLEDSVIQSFDSLLEAIVRTAEEEKEKENEKEIEVYSIRPEVANKGIAPSSTPRQKKKSSFDFFRVIFKGMARSVSVSS